MKRFLPYFNIKNLRRIFSRGNIHLDDHASRANSKPSLPPVSISLGTANPEILEHFGLLAARCCRAPFSFICGLDGQAVWRHSNFPIDIEPVRADLLAHLRQSTGNDIGEIRKRPSDERKTGDGSARFAAFGPIRTRSGELIGALCILDDKERTFTDEDRSVLKIATQQMVERLELQRQTDQFAHCQEAIESVLHFFQNHKTRGTRDVFLPFLVRHLASLAQVERVFIAEVTPEHPNVARTVAVCLQGARVENFDYPLSNSPFDGVTSRHVCCFEKDVLKEFPGDHFLKDIKGSGYAGISLLDSAGKLNGLIVFVDREPLQKPVVLESILVILASRVAAELENRRLETALGISESKYQNLYEHTTEGIYQLSPDDRFMSVNPAMALILGYSSPTELIQQVASVSQDLYADPERRSESMKQLRTEAEVLGPPCQMIRKDGQRIWISEKLRAVRDSQGNLLHYAGVVKDITALKEAEESGVLFQSRFHTVFEQASLGVALMDEKGVIVQSNPSLSNLLGFPADELRGVPIASLCHPDDFSSCTQLLSECGAGRRAMGRLELRCVRKDRQLVWVALTLSTGGATQSMIAMLQDRTEHHQIQQALAESTKAIQTGDARFNALSDCSEVGILVMDHLGRITHSNSALENLLGYSRSELQLKIWSDLSHPDDWKAHEPALAQCLEGARPRFQFEGRFLRKTGEPIFGRLTISITPGNSETGKSFVGVMEDLTIQQRGEEDLRTSNQRFHAMFESAAIGVVLLDRDGKITLSNHSLVETLGLTRDSILAKSLSDFSHPEDAPKIRQIQEECVNGKRDYHLMEIRMAHKDKSIVWMRLTITVVREANGAFQYAIAMMEDITERVRKEQALLAVDAPLQSLLEVAETGVAFTDPQGRFTQTNSVLQKLLGYSPEEFLSRAIISFCHPEDRKNPPALLDEWLAGKRNDCRFDIRLKRRDQQSVWTRLTLSTIRGREKLAHYGVALFEDISREKTLQENMASKEMDYCALLGQTGVGIALADQKGRLLDANPSLVRLLGFSVAELKFKSITDFSHPDDLGEYNRLYADCVDKKRPGFEVEQRCVGQNGRTFWGRLVLNFVPVPTGSGTVLVVTIQDVTARKQIEDEFARSEASFQAMFDGSPMGVALLDRQGAIFRHNTQLAEMLGSAAGELKGQSFLEMAHAEERSHLTQFQTDSMKNKRERFQVETRLARKDRSLLQSRVTLSLIKNPSPSGPHLIAIVENVAPRRDAELALAEIRRKLRDTEEELKTTENRLLQTSQKLSSADRSLKEKTEAAATTRDTIHALEGKLHGLHEGLQAAQARYRLLFNQPGIGVALLDSHGRFSEANAALESLLGFSRTDLLAKPLGDLVHPDDLPALVSTQADCVATGKDHFQMDLRLFKKQAEGIWARITGSILREKNNEPSTTSIFVEDITAHVLSHELAQINHARFEALCQHNHAAIILCDENDHITYVNPSLERLLQFSHEEILSKPMSDLVHSSDKHLDVPLHAECLQGPRDHYEAEKCLRRKDQKPVWTRATTSIVRGADGRPGYCIRVFEEISPRRVAPGAVEADQLSFHDLESKLRGEEEKLRGAEVKPRTKDNGHPPPKEKISPTLRTVEKPKNEKKETRAVARTGPFHEMIHAFITVDMEDRIVHLNSRAEELLSCKHTTVFGKHLHEVFAVLRERHLRTTGKSSSAHAAGLLVTKTWVKHGDGSEHIYLQSSSVLLADNGNPIGKVIVFQNFDETNNLQQTMLESNRIPSHAIFDEQLAHEFDRTLASLCKVANPLLTSLNKDLHAGKDGWTRSLEAAQRQSNAMHDKLLAPSVSPAGSKLASP